MLVSHALAYVTASKNGVSEPEIEDFISLDDKVGFWTVLIFVLQTWHSPPAVEKGDVICKISKFHKRQQIC